MTWLLQVFEKQNRFMEMFFRKEKSQIYLKKLMIIFNTEHWQNSEPCVMAEIRACCLLALNGALPVIWLSIRSCTCMSAPPEGAELFKLICKDTQQLFSQQEGEQQNES